MSQSDGAFIDTAAGEFVKFSWTEDSPSVFEFGVDAVLTPNNQNTTALVAVGFVFGYRPVFSRLDVSAAPVFVSQEHVHGEVYAVFRDSAGATESAQCGLFTTITNDVDLLCSQHGSALTFEPVSLPDVTSGASVDGSWAFNVSRIKTSYINMNAAYGFRRARALEQTNTPELDDRFVMPIVIASEVTVNASEWDSDAQLVSSSPGRVRMWFGDWIDINTGFPIFPSNGVFTLPPTTPAPTQTMLTVPPRPTASDFLGPAFERREQDTIAVATIPLKSELFDPLMTIASYVMLAAVGVVLFAAVALTLQIKTMIDTVMEALDLSDV